MIGISHNMLDDLPLPGDSPTQALRKLNRAAKLVVGQQTADQQVTSDVGDTMNDRMPIVPLGMNILQAEREALKRERQGK